MRFGSLFSGVGGFDLGFERAGMTCVWQAENNKYASQVLAKHWPQVKRYEDVRDVGRNAEAVDLICGGFPCQDLSVAGKRAGLAGERSGLWFEFRRIIEELAPTWVVIENVPGLLSSNKGGDMAVLLGGLAQLGYGWAYRVLDSQYFGVAQRRRRVFVVANLGGATAAAKVLFEPESRDWDTPPRRKTGKEDTRIAGTLASSGGGMDRPAGNANELDFAIPTVSSKWAKGSGGPAGDETQNLVMTAPRTFTVRGGKEGGGKGYLENVDGGMTLGGQPQWVALQQNTRDEVRQVNGDGAIAGALAAQPGMKQQNYLAWHENQGGHLSAGGDTARAIKASASNSYQGVGVRRLTPIECERLQGFPDGWTAGQSDTQRYRQIGNAVTVNVIEWLGRRIVEFARKDGDANQTRLVTR